MCGVCLKWDIQPTLSSLPYQPETTRYLQHPNNYSRHPSCRLVKRPRPARSIHPKAYSPVGGLCDHAPGGLTPRRVRTCAKHIKTLYKISDVETRLARALQVPGTEVWGSCSFWRLRVYVRRPSFQCWCLEDFERDPSQPTTAQP